MHLTWWFTYNSFGIYKQQVFLSVVLHARKHELPFGVGRFPHKKITVLLQQSLRLCPTDLPMKPDFVLQLGQIRLGSWFWVLLTCEWFYKTDLTSQFLMMRARVGQNFIFIKKTNHDCFDFCTFLLVYRRYKQYFMSIFMSIFPSILILWISLISVF